MARTRGRRPVRAGSRAPVAADAGAYRRGVLTGVGGTAAVVALAGVLVWAPVGSVERTAQELRVASAQRDREQIAELTATARATVADVAGIVGEMAGAPADGEQAADREAVLAEAAATYDDPPSGETATNVARGSLAAAADLLVEAATTQRFALDLDGEDRAAALERAAMQRDLAIRVWSVGATQLDAVNIDAGNGHQHAFLPPGGTGALTPDGAADGEGARERP